MFRSGSASLGLDYYVLSISSGVVVVLVYFCSTSAFVGWRFVSHRRRMAVKARNAHKQTVNDQSLHRKESWSHITLTWTWTAFYVLLLSVSSHSLGLFTTLLFRSKNRLFLEMMPIQWNRMKLKMRLSFFSMSFSLLFPHSLKEMDFNRNDGFDWIIHSYYHFINGHHHSSDFEVLNRSQLNEEKWIFSS